MILLPPFSTPTYTLLPYTTLFRSPSNAAPGSRTICCLQSSSGDLRALLSCRNPHPVARAGVAIPAHPRRQICQTLTPGHGFIQLKMKARFACIGYEPALIPRPPFSLTQPHCASGQSLYRVQDLNQTDRIGRTADQLARLTRPEGHRSEERRVG